MQTPGWRLGKRAPNHGGRSGDPRGSVEPRIGRVELAIASCARIARRSAGTRRKRSSPFVYLDRAREMQEGPLAP